jgi:hypothetical protein
MQPTVLSNDEIKWGPESKWSKTGKEVRYVAFADKYVSVMVGHRKLNAFYKKYPTKTLFDKIDPSDEAFAMLVVKNNQKLWYEQYQQSQKDEDRDNKDIAQEMSEHEGDETNETTMKTRPEWTGQKAGTKNKYLSTGWSDEGMKYYNNMVKKFTTKRDTVQQRKNLNLIWRRNFAKNHNHVLSLSPTKRKEMVLGEEFNEEPPKPAPVFDWTPNSDDEEELDGQESTPI